MECSCESWQLTGIPCEHAVKVITPLRRPWIDFCHGYHTVEKYKLAYEGYITPMAEIIDWDPPKPKVIEPLIKPRAGRPSKKRLRDQDENEPITGVVAKHCGECGVAGHYNSTCVARKAQGWTGTKRPRVPNRLPTMGSSESRQASTNPPTVETNTKRAKRAKKTRTSTGALPHRNATPQVREASGSVQFPWFLQPNVCKDINSSVPCVYIIKRK